jgi:alpha-glucoside transport system substrate-binding protein
MRLRPGISRVSAALTCEGHVRHCLYVVAAGRGHRRPRCGREDVTCRRGRRLATPVVAGLLSVGLATSGCDLSAKASPDACAEYHQYGHFAGKTVDVYSHFVTPDDKTILDALAPFERCTGVRVTSEADQNFELTALARVESATPPDIAIVPQPGLYWAMVASHHAKPAAASVVKNLDRYWRPEWRALVTRDGTVYGAPLSANVKSLVWYAPKRFKQQGYQIPTTLDDLLALTRTIAATGAKPWCEGIDQGHATGWPITDWMEDMMLRLSGPHAYDAWVAHTIPFDSPGPSAALDEVGTLLKNNTFVNGGLGDVSSIVRTNFFDAAQPILTGDCWMHHSPSFAAFVWPPGTSVAPNGDVWAFYLPGKDTSSQPIITGGEFTLAFSDRPEVQALQTYLSSPTWADNVAVSSNGDWLSANNAVDTSKLTPLNKMAYGLLQDPRSVLRFDGSDQMPPKIGLHVFYEQMTAWISGQSRPATLRNIDRQWPRT